MDILDVSLSLVTRAGVSVDATVPGEELGGEFARDLRPGLVRVTGTVSRTGEEYVFRGTVSGTFTRSCDRCLAEAEVPFESEALWVFAPGAKRDPFEGIEDGSAETIPVEGGIIPLAPQAWEEVVLAFSARFVCADLDPEGVECTAPAPDALSEEDGAEDELSNKGLAGLGEMFPDLRPADSEE